MGVITARHQYLYLATEQQALLLCEFGHEISEIEPLVFFGYTDFDDFMVKCPSFASCEEYEPAGASESKLCPACLVAVGEYHLLGCPVEICPWCDGQLSWCGCRFEQLGVAELTEEEELEELERILEEKGRIPYTQDTGHPTCRNQKILTGRMAFALEELRDYFLPLILLDSEKYLNQRRGQARFCRR